MKYRIITMVLLFSLTLAACKKSPKKNRNVVTGVTWTLNAKTYVANNIQVDFQNVIDGYYEVDAMASTTTDSTELIFGINNGATTGDHSVPTYWVYCSVYDKSTHNQQSYVFENYQLNIASVYGMYVSGSFTATKILGPTLTCTFTDIKSTP